MNTKKIPLSDFASMDLKPGPVVPTPEGVSNGAPAVERKGAHTPPPTGILRWQIREAGGRLAYVDAFVIEDAFFLASKEFGVHGALSALRSWNRETGIVAHDFELKQEPAILSWAPERQPLTDERPSEHIRNALQIVYELETLLQASGDYTQPYRACVADVKRRLGWALRASRSNIEVSQGWCANCGVYRDG